MAVGKKTIRTAPGADIRRFYVMGNNALFLELIPADTPEIKMMPPLAVGQKRPGKFRFIMNKFYHTKR